MEATTGSKTHSDFSALLDDMFVARDEQEDSAARPTIPFDYLAVVDELHSGRIRVSGRDADATYRDALADEQSDTDLPHDEAEPEPVRASEPEPPLSVDPDVIAAELGLSSVRAAELGRLRRNFAMKNHPDRVAPHLRSRALARMQVANGLIDEARRRAERASAR